MLLSLFCERSVTHRIEVSLGGAGHWITAKQVLEISPTNAERISGLHFYSLHAYRNLHISPEAQEMLHLDNLTFDFEDRDTVINKYLTTTRSLRLTRKILPLSSMLFPQLTKLTIENSGEDVVSHALYAIDAPALRHLLLSHIEWEDIDVFPLSLISLPSLNTLDIDSCDIELWSAIGRSLVVPSLSSLDVNAFTLRDTDRRGEFLARCLSDLVSRGPDYKPLC